MNENRQLGSSAVENLIREAFRGVQLGGGISLREADVIDGYGSVEERRAARSQDERFDWLRIDADDIDHFYASLSFLDAEGLRFYIPAFMVWCLNHYQSTESITVYSTIRALSVPDSAREHQLVRFRMFSREQAEAIRGFLRFFASPSQELINSHAAHQALEQYWERAC